MTTPLADSPLPPPDPSAIGEIDYRTCRQGPWDDCWFLSALTCLAFKRPEDVRNMICANADGSFEVTFPNKSPVNVWPEDGASCSDGVWVRVLEAAAGKFTEVTRCRFTEFGEGIQLLTGCGTNWSSNVLGFGFGPLVPLPFNDNTLGDKLQTAEERKRVVVLGGSDGTITTVKVDGLVHRHCYAILAYEADTQHARLRDPLGDDDRIPNRKKPHYGPGEFWLTLEEVNSSFCGLAIEKR